MAKITKKHADITLTYEADSIDEIMELITTHERADDNKTMWASMPKDNPIPKQYVGADYEATLPGTHPAFPSAFAPVNFAEYLEEKQVTPDKRYGDDEVVVHMTPAFRDELASYLRHASNDLYRPPIMTGFDCNAFAAVMEELLPIYRSEDEKAIELSVSTEFRDELVSYLRNSFVVKPGDFVVGEAIKWELPEEMKAAIVRLECAAAALEDRDYSKLTFNDLRLLEMKVKTALRQKALKA